MKLGEIKIQSLMLIFPSAELEYDESDLNEVVFVLKAHPSYASYISGSVGAINRALGIIEAQTQKPLKRISYQTSNDSEMEFDEALAQIIPYFVKADLLLSESPSESRDAREIFDNLLARVLKNEAISQSVYSYGELK